MEVFLHDHIASASKRLILRVDERGVHRGLPGGVLGPINKTQEVAGVEETKTMDLVHRGNSVSETRHDLRPELETKVKMVGTNVEK